MLTSPTRPDRPPVLVPWRAPKAGDLNGFKVLAGTEQGGPYTPVHSGSLDPLRESFIFQAVGGGETYYVVLKAVDRATNESVPSLEVSVVVP